MRTLATTRTRSEIISQQIASDSYHIHRVGVSYNLGQTQDIGTFQLGDYTHKYEDRTTKDVVTPDYEALKQRGIVVMNDYSTTRTIRNDPQGVFVGSAGVEGWLQYGTVSACIEALIPRAYWPQSSLSSFNVDTLVNLAVTDVHAKVDEATVQGLVSVAELHKTVAGLARLYRQLLKLIKSAYKARRLLLNGIISVAEATELYLQVRYGLRPLYYDMLSYIKVIDSFNDNKRVRLISVMADNKGSTTPVSCYVGNNWSSSGTLIDHKKIEVRAGILLQPTLNSNELLEKLRSQVGLDQFAESVWELVPWSFIIDWFVNAGRLIAAWTPELETKILGSWVTVDETNTRICTCNNYNRIDYYTFYCSNVGVTGSDITRIRTRYANPQLPQFPVINIRLSTLKVADLLAIISNKVANKNMKWMDFIHRFKF